MNIFNKIKEKIIALNNSTQCSKQETPILVKGQDLKLSKNFNLSEFIKSSTADRLGIDNWPTDYNIVYKLQALCDNVLQPVRDHYGRSVRINSGFRTLELNTALPGAKTSQHMEGEAADIEIDGVPNKELAEYIAKTCQFDQLILEYWYEEDPNSGWVHVSFVSPNRRDKKNRNQKLTINKHGVFNGFQSQ